MTRRKPKLWVVLKLKLDEQTDPPMSHSTDSQLIYHDENEDKDKPVMNETMIVCKGLVCLSQALSRANENFRSQFHFRLCLSR